MPNYKVITCKNRSETVNKANHGVTYHHHAFGDMSRAIGHIGREMHRGGGNNVQFCRIPRRSPSKTTRPTLASRPVLKSPHDANPARGRYMSPPPPPRHLRNDRPQSDLQKKQDLMKPFFNGTVSEVQRDVMTRTEDVKRRQEFQDAQPQEKPSAQSVLLLLHDSEDSFVSTEEKVKQLQISLRDKYSHFKQIKSELSVKQMMMKEVFSEMKSAQELVKSLGGDSMATELPSLEELGFIDTHTKFHQLNGVKLADGKLLESLVPLPAGLATCCDAAVRGQREIVLWINSLLTSKEKGIKMQELSNKLTEFTKKYQEVADTFDSAKLQFINEAPRTADFLRVEQEEREKLRRDGERLAVEVAELKAQNGDLHKQLLSADHPKNIHAEKAKIEELEKQLKEEKCKRFVVCERLTRSEVQVQTGASRADALQEDLETAGCEVLALQATVKQLQDQNLQIQMKFDSELNKLTSSLNESAKYVQEVTKAREILEAEKKDLESRLEESEYESSEAVKTLKSELTKTVSQLYELEVQKSKLTDNNVQIKMEWETVCTKITAAEEQNKILTIKLQEKEAHLENKAALQRDLEATSEALAQYAFELESLKLIVQEKQNIIYMLEQNKTRHEELKESLTKELKEKEQSIMVIKTELMTELRSKTDCISGLKKKLAEVENEYKESESKIQSYENELHTLKSNLDYLSHDDDEEISMDCFSELRQLIIEQRTKLIEATRQNGELAEELQRKDTEIQEHEHTLNALHSALSRSEELVQMLSKKEQEQANVINVLQKDVEMRIVAELETNQRLAGKSEEAKILLANVEQRKQEICQLEEIILTLEDQSCKMRAVKKSLQERIADLERKLSENKRIKSKMNVPAEYLDNLITVLEEELGKSEFDEFRNMGEESFSLAKGARTGHYRSRSPRAFSPVRGKTRCNDTDVESCLGDTYKIVKKTSSSGLLENVNKSVYPSNNSARSRSRDLNRYDRAVDNCRWISGRQNDINVYHTLRTDIELNSGGCRYEPCSSARDLPKPPPQPLRAHNMSLAAPPRRAHPQYNRDRTTFN